MSALVNEKAFNYIIGIASLLFFFVYILQTIGLSGRVPQAAPSPRQSPAPSTWAGGGCRSTSPRLSSSSRVAVALLFLPQFASNKWVFLGVVAVAAAWWATGLRSRLSRGDAGSDYAKTHLN